MEHYEFELGPITFQSLTNEFRIKGKNSDIGSLSISIAKKWLASRYPNATIEAGTKGADIRLTTEDGKLLDFEVKGTEDDLIAFNKLKVSGIPCHTKLIGRMPIIRITKVRKRKVDVYVLRYGIDFELIPEPRWSIKPIQDH